MSQILGTAAGLLDELTGARITNLTDLGVTGAPVLRIELDGEYAGIGRTVIAKSHRQLPTGWGVNPSHLDNECRALQHLKGNLAPRFLAADDGVVLMTDLGPGPSIQQLLFGSGTVDTATAGLIGIARTAGLLHAATDRLAGFRAAHQISFLDRPVDTWTELATAAEDLGFPPPVGIAEDLETLTKALADERFRGFTQGDLTPNNAVLVGDVVHLVDYEGAGVRHLGMDAACLRLPFPHYGQWAVLPDSLLSAMDEVYREELVRGVRAAADDTRYELFMAAGCMAWAVVRASRLRLIASPEDAVRRRTQIVQTLTSASETASRTRSFPALTAWFGVLVDEMKSRWDEARLEPRKFPVFS